MIWTAPGGTGNGLILNMLRQPHLLIAGATGSGKSVLINSLIYTALLKAPSQLELILIDPKRVELIEYANLPHTISYASEPGPIVNAITGAVDIMECRYNEMQRQRLKMYPGPDIYIVIDEYADLMTTLKKQTLRPIQRIAQLGFI